MEFSIPLLDFNSVRSLSVVNDSEAGSVVLNIPDFFFWGVGGGWGVGSDIRWVNAFRPEILAYNSLDSTRA